MEEFFLQIGKLHLIQAPRLATVSQIHLILMSKVEENLQNMSRKTLSCLLANNCNQKFDTSFVQTTFLPLNFGEILEILFLTQSYSMDTIRDR